MRLRVVQPVKQAFHELYLFTLAEQETQTYSDRFANHMIVGAKASKLFGRRNWRVDSRDFVIPYKELSGIYAVFMFDAAYYYLGSDLNYTTSSICFRRQIHDESESWIRLEDIPPVVFSEVMRDADLITSVAYIDAATIAAQHEMRVAEYNRIMHLSDEMYQRRRDLIVALLDDLGLQGVTIKGRFAFIQGKLAKYRVHLRNGIIHIEPNNHLCIVPDNWSKKHSKVFLPFADEGNDEIREVISKILILLKDNRIKDESILMQIRKYS